MIGLKTGDRMEAAIQEMANVISHFLEVLWGREVRMTFQRIFCETAPLPPAPLLWPVWISRVLEVVGHLHFPLGIVFSLLVLNTVE